MHQETGGGSKPRGPRQSRSVSPQDEDGHLTLKTEDQPLDLHSTQYVNLLWKRSFDIEHMSHGCYSPSHEWQDHVAAVLRNRGSEPNFSTILSERKASGVYNLYSPSPALSSSDRRQRRKLSGEGLSTDLSKYDLSSVRDDRQRSASTTSTLSDEDVLDAVGQLSLNEDEEVRYHGKASGLHLLGGKERDDSRNEGGIWLVSLFFLAINWIS